MNGNLFKWGRISINKVIITVALAIFLLAIVSNLAIAKENETTCETKSSTVVETKEQVFRIGPTVSLRPLNSEINKSQDGIVELFLNNPSLNDCPLEVDMVISVPSDIYINAQDGGMSGGAGTVTGHFSVSPGSSRTITLHIKGEKVGTFPVHFGGNYWPGTNKDQWNPINLDNSFEVTETRNPYWDPNGQNDVVPKHEIPYTYLLGGMTVIIGIIQIYQKSSKK
jgi:hypothetical protein